MPEHTIAENLARLQAARTAIGAAITAKGGTVNSGDGFEEFPADIAAIPSGGEPEPPADGKTRLYISLAEGRLSPVLGLAVSGSVDVDWGDGTAHGTLTGTDISTLVTIPHTYAQGGDYVITLTATERTKIAVLGAIGGSLVSTKDGTDTSESRVYQASLKKAYVGDSVTSIGGYAFQYCYGLTNVVIPDSVTSIGDFAFNSCYGLTNVVIPGSVTSIGQNAFSNCYGLTNVVIPDSVTIIINNAFTNCYSLTSVTIPDSVTSIGSNTFRYCYGLASIKFESTTPPTIGGSTTFSGLPTDCIIYVPEGSLDNYTSATNYPDDSVYTYVEY